MTSLFAVTLMAIIGFGEPAAVDRPLVTVNVADGTKVTLRHMNDGKRPYIKIEAAGVTFTAKQIRLVNGNIAVNLDAVADGIRCVQGDAVVLLGEQTFVGRTKNE